MRTAFTDLVGVEHPLVGFNRSPAVVAEVSKAGGLGVLAATAFTPAELDAQLTWIEEQVGDKPYGVDLLVPGKAATGDPARLVESLRAQIPQQHIDWVEQLISKYDIPPLPENAHRSGDGTNVDPSMIPALLDVCFKHRIALIANALGTPPPFLTERAKREGVPVAALVGKPEHARRQIAAGVDLIIAQGYEAGGHTGEIATMVLTPEIVDIADAAGIPVLAAGGIASGRQMAAALCLGAAGVWCGSVWLNTVEDVTIDPIKQKFLAATSSDTARSKVRTGKPARQLRSAWHEAWESEGAPAPLPMPLQPMLTLEAWDRIDDAALHGNEGAMKLESFFVGQVVGSFTEIRRAADVVHDLVEGCREALTRNAQLTSA